MVNIEDICLIIKSVNLNSRILLLISKFKFNFNESVKKTSCINKESLTCDAISFGKQ